MTEIKLVTVTKCEAGYHGTIKQGANAGDPFTLYNIEGLDENGQPIPRTLNSFSDLPLGPAQYEVSRYDKPQNDGSVKTSFTLKPLKGARTAPQAQASPQTPAHGDGPTRAEHNALVKRMETIEQIIAGRINQTDVTQPSLQERAAPAAQPGSQWGDDPPW